MIFCIVSILYDSQIEHLRTLEKELRSRVQQMESQVTENRDAFKPEDVSVQVEKQPQDVPGVMDYICNIALLFFHAIILHR